MSPWKVILATLVIFCSGLVTGAVLVKQFSTKPHTQHRVQQAGNQPAPPAAWHNQQRELMRRMDKELNLTPEQRDRIDKILRESQERTKPIREKIAEEMKSVREQIRTELNPEQREKYEASLKKMAAKKEEKKEEKQEEHRRRNPAKETTRTNAPATTNQ